MKAAHIIVRRRPTASVAAGSSRRASLCVGGLRVVGTQPQPRAGRAQSVAPPALPPTHGPTVRRSPPANRSRRTCARQRDAVDLHFRSRPPKSTGGLLLGRSANDPDLFNYFLPDAGAAAQRPRSASVHQSRGVQDVVTRDNITWSGALSRVGDAPSPGLRPPPTPVTFSSTDSTVLSKSLPMRWALSRAGVSTNLSPRHLHDRSQRQHRTGGRGSPAFSSSSPPLRTPDAARRICSPRQ